MKRLFNLGTILATPGVLAMAEELGVNLETYLLRHVSGDWGDLSEDDKQENRYSLGKNLRILSAYNTPGGRIWIITEADRSATTILFSSEY
jgi:hypothetical protein